jgi:hypothetical protein
MLLIVAEARKRIFKTPGIVWSKRLESLTTRSRQADPHNTPMIWVARALDEPVPGQSCHELSHVGSRDCQTAGYGAHGKRLRLGLGERRIP